MDDWDIPEESILDEFDEQWEEERGRCPRSLRATPDENDTIWDDHYEEME